MITVCLTHDVDRVRKTYQYFTHTAKYLLHGQVKRAFRSLARLFIKRSPYWGFDEVIDIENRYGVKSTFFFLNESAKTKWFDLSSYRISLGRYSIENRKVQKVIRYLDQNGWEIGVHGSFYSYNNLALLKAEKDDLEAIVGHDVIGIRQHNLNFMEDTWKLQEVAGYKYDSTWGFNFEIGFKEGHVKPFQPLANSQFVEIPMNIMDSSFENTKDHWNKLEEILTEIDKQDAYFVLNFHTNNYDEVDFPNYKNNYIRLIELLQRRNVKFIRMCDAYDQIIKQ